MPERSDELKDPDRYVMYHVVAVIMASAVIRDARDTIKTVIAAFSHDSRD